MEKLTDVLSFIRSADPEVWDLVHREIASAAKARSKAFVTQFHSGLRVSTTWPKCGEVVYGRVVRVRGDRLLVDAERNELGITEFWAPANMFAICAEQEDSCADRAADTRHA
jgi:hypothetical protein